LYHRYTKSVPSPSKAQYNALKSTFQIRQFGATQIKKNNQDTASNCAVWRNGYLSPLKFQGDKNITLDQRNINSPNFHAVLLVEYKPFANTI
jgi:hypothetical protein